MRDTDPMWTFTEADDDGETHLVGCTPSYRYGYLTNVGDISCVYCYTCNKTLVDHLPVPDQAAFKDIISDHIRHANSIIEAIQHAHRLGFC